MIASIFRRVCPPEHIAENALLRDYTSMRVGGPADLLISPAGEEEAVRVLQLAQQEGIPVCLLGNGSNLLVSDEGFRGVVLHLGKNFSAVTCSENHITAQAGAMLSATARAAADNSLEGLAFAGGIPGSVGGAVFMNAGAYGGEIAQVFHRARVYTQGSVREFNCEQMDFRYRHSALMDSDGVLLSAEFLLHLGNKDEINTQMADYNARRRDKQPLQYPSCGSFFKRPAGHFAGALIEQAGLKGFAIGDAQVSEKHAGFIINRGHATAAQVYALMRHVQQAVHQSSGVMLEPEVRLIGRFEA